MLQSTCVRQHFKMKRQSLWAGWAHITTHTHSQHVVFNWFLFGSDFSITIIASWCCIGSHTCTFLTWIQLTFFFIHSLQQIQKRKRKKNYSLFVQSLDFSNNFFLSWLRCVYYVAHWRFSMCRFFPCVCLCLCFFSLNVNRIACCCNCYKICSDNHRYSSTNE